MNNPYRALVEGFANAFCTIHNRLPTGLVCLLLEPLQLPQSTMTVDELFARILKVHAGETNASIGCNLEPDPCPNWFWRLERPDRFTITMINFFLVEEMDFSRPNYGNLTPYAEDNPIVTRYHEWRPIRPTLGSY